MSSPSVLDNIWPVFGERYWTTLSTGLISRDHKKILEIQQKQHANAKLTESLAVCYLNETFIGAVKALAESPGYKHCFVRTTHGYDQSDRLFFVSPNGNITDKWADTLEDYYDAFIEDAIIVVALSQTEAEERRFEHKCAIDELILSSDP